MQVVTPIDIADAIRADLAAIVDDRRFFCIPIPPDLQAGDVVIESLGGSGVSGSADVYDVTVSVYDVDEDTATQAANEISGIVASLPLRVTSTQYSNATANKPYADHDPRAPQLARQSFRASIICPGEKIEF
jgi:hypothetical protein